MVFTHNWDENTLFRDNDTESTHPKPLGVLSIERLLSFIASQLRKNILECILFSLVSK